MASTALYDPSPDPTPISPRPGVLLDTYRGLIDGGDLAWTTRCHDLQPLGSGGQGVVFVARKEGADGFTLPISLKVFSPESYRGTESYDEDMGRIAAVAARVATIQHQNLIYISDFTSHNGVRIMGMEFVDGYDLKAVLTRSMLDRSRAQLTPAHWGYVNDVILSDGPAQPRLKPGVAIQILRDCLAGLAALHREGITHGDLKPSNLMLKRSGTVKVVDIGSAVDLQVAGGRRIWSPAYAAPEVLDGSPVTPQADLASLGYILIEMLAGRQPFAEAQGIGGLRQAKQEFEATFPELLPDEVAGNDLLIDLCRRLVASDPARRFPDAQAADLGRRGAAAFHRQLVKGDLASEYGNDLRVWLEELRDTD